MIKHQKFLIRLLICLFSAILFVFFMAFISPRILFLGKFDAAQYVIMSAGGGEQGFVELNVWWRALIASVVFILLTIFTRMITSIFLTRIEEHGYEKERTKLFMDFVNDLKFTNTGEELVAVIQKDLEYKANCEVTLIEAKTDFVDYNCGSRFVSDPKTFERLDSLFKSLKTGALYFFNNQLEIVKNTNTAKGFAIVTDRSRFIVVCRFIKDVETSVFDMIFNEYLNYEKRSETMGELLALSELAQEWNMVSETQMSFLPSKIPDVRDLDIAAYYKPLVNVSGDYYDFIEVDEYKTIFVVGDVSGKGLPAALIMGVVINTIRIAQDKEDLEGIIRSVDTAIKRMNLIDKYTVLFLSLIDTKKMTIKYINASIENPMILTESIDGYKIKSLDSTCGVVGIIDLDDIGVVEKPLYRGDVLFMTTDGIPETTNAEGIELGETEQYAESLKTYAMRSADYIVNSISKLALTYSVGSKIRDDITVVAVKIKG